MEWLSGQTDSQWMSRILKTNPQYGEAYAMGGHFFVINYRYEDAIAAYRKAIALNPNLWPAHSQLGINLMRLGRDEEGRAQLEMAYQAHFRDAQTVNALRFLDTLKDFQLFKDGNSELLLSKKEAPLLKPYVQAELQRAIATYARKYGTEFKTPIRLEIYPNHDDFVVRTTGLPGQGSLLGVTFGTVVAMDSPSARAPGEFSWADTLWHELNHVFVIEASHHLVPRWFTEGLAVHEEALASPAWGNRLTPDIVQAISQKRLLPVKDLDRGFVRPSYPDQMLVSYFQAGKTLDYIASKWGDSAVIAMIHSFANRRTTVQAIEECLKVSSEDFDKDFLSWLDGQTSHTVHHFGPWRAALMNAHRSFDAGKTDEALRQAEFARDIFPAYVSHASAYELLAKIHSAKGQPEQAAGDLERYRDLGGTNVVTLEKLADLEKSLTRPQEAITTCCNSLNNQNVYFEFHSLYSRPSGNKSAGDDLPQYFGRDQARGAQGHRRTGGCD
jgi:tetratricopeptide (TPR) repeat protein